MDFLVYPENGYLNTNFGFKLLSNQKRITFRFVFLEDNVKTDWLNENVFVYYSFKSAGQKNIRLEIKDKNPIIKQINVIDSAYFGEGATKEIRIATKSNKLVIKKSNGLKIYDIFSKNVFSLKLSFDDLIEISKDKAILIKNNSKEKKIGIINLSNGLFDFEIKGIFKGYNDYKKIIIMQTDDIIQLIDSKTYQIIKENGNIVLINDTRSRLVISFKEHLYCYNVSENLKKKIGEFKFTKSFDIKNGFIVLRDNKSQYIYDIYLNIFICDYNADIFDIHIRKKSIKPNLLSTKGDFVDSKNILTFKPISRIVYFINNYHSQLFFGTIKINLIKSNKINSEEIFEKWLSNGKYYVTKNKNKFILYNFSNRKLLHKTENEILEIITYKNQKVIIEYGINQNIYFLDLKSKKEIVKFNGYFNMNNLFKLFEFKQLWISQRRYSNSFDIYNELTSKKVLTVNLYREVNKYYITDTTILNKKDLSILYRFKENLDLKNYSDNLELIVFKNNDGYFCVKNILQDSNTTESKIQDLDKIYKSSEISPSGDKVILSSENNTEIIDLSTFEIIKTLKTNFIKFDNTGNLLCSNQRDYYWGNPRIFDPNTFEEIHPENLCKYQFASPDDKFSIYVQKSKYLFFDAISDKLLGEIENKYPFLDYTNYISFCPQNNIICIAGKISYNTGNLKFLTYQISDGKLSYKWLAPFSTKYAIWKCDFSSLGSYLGAYDSIPTTYLFKVQNNYSYLYKTINHRSFECFSPDEKRVVLSNNKYEALTSGGRGWLTSNSLWIVSLYDWSTIKELTEHNDEIVYANYSQDGTKLLSRSRDGVVIVRNDI